MILESKRYGRKHLRIILLSKTYRHRPSLLDCYRNYISNKANKLVLSNVDRCLCESLERNEVAFVVNELKILFR